MKTQNEIEQMIQDLEEKRIKQLEIRDNAKNDFDQSVAQNLMLVYVMQQNILLEVLR